MPNVSTPRRFRWLPRPVRGFIRRQRSRDVVNKAERAVAAVYLLNRIGRIDPDSPSDDHRAIVALRLYVAESIKARLARHRVRFRRSLDWSLKVAVPDVAARIGTDIRESIRSVANERESFDDASARLVGRLEEIDPETASGYEWLRLRYILAAHGFIEGSAVVRELARGSVIARARGEGASAEALVLGALLCLDDGDISQAQQLFEELPPGAQRPDSARNLRSFLALAASDRDRFLELAEQRRGPDDAGMLALVRGRSVAIVGPSPTKLEHGDEIDEHDLVVRFTYTGPDTTGPVETAGSRTDIAYYRRPYYVRPVLRTEGNQVVLPTDLKYGVVERDLRPYTGVPLRLGFGPAAPGVFGMKVRRYQKLQFALYDLLHFEPMSVTIYNTSFYWSSEVFRDGFASPRVASSRPIDLCSQFSRHDPVGNRNVVRNVLSGYGVSADDEVSHVLAMPTREYARGLDRLFGSATWKV